MQLILGLDFGERVLVEVEKQRSRLRRTTAFRCGEAEHRKAVFRSPGRGQRKISRCDSRRKRTVPDPRFGINDST